jgi:WD40 repeat protein
MAEMKGLLRLRNSRSTRMWWITLMSVACCTLWGSDVPPKEPAHPSDGPGYRRISQSDQGPAKQYGVKDARPVFAARFDAAGKTLLTTTHDAVYLWKIPSMEPAAEPLSVRPLITAADLSPDGSLILTADRAGSLRVRQVGGKEPLWTRRCEKGYECAFFHPDGKSVFVIERGDNAVRIIDALNGKESHAIHDTTSRYRLGAAISQDGDRIMTSSLGPTRIWSTRTGTAIAKFPAFGAIFALSPKGDRVAGQASAGDVSVFDVETGEELAVLDFGYRNDSQVANVHAVTFSPDGRFVARSVEDLGVQIWDLSAEKAKSRWLKQAPVSKMMFTPDGAHIILRNSDGATIWDVKTAGRIALMDKTIPGTPASVGTAVTADGRFIAVNYGGPVELWERK